jgi:diadenosine tetraphosphate (Ap4A) HIT family hydrolase
VIPKQHVASDIFNVDFNVVHNGLDSAKICAGMLKNSLNATRVCLVAEGMEIDHMHFKLYPMYSSEDGNYQGLNTKNGPMADPNELEELARRVGGNKN